jgi:hypothetical protein
VAITEGEGTGEVRIATVPFVTSIVIMPPSVPDGIVPETAPVIKMVLDMTWFLLRIVEFGISLREAAWAVRALENLG